MQKLLTKSKFARLKGVNPSTVTRLCKTLLQEAVVGKYIDAAHPVAVAYQPEPAQKPTQPDDKKPATGIDPLYEKAVGACVAANRFSITFLQKELHVGYNRAAKIIQLMRNVGLIEGEGTATKATEKMPTETEIPITQKPRGQAAVKEQKKAAAAAEAASDESQIYEVPEDIQAFADMTLRDLIEKFGTDARFLDWLKATQVIEGINEKRLKNAQTEGLLVAREKVRVGIIEPLDSVHIKLLTDGAKTIARRSTAMHDAGRDLDEIEKFIKDQISSFIRPVKTRVARAFKNA